MFRSLPIALSLALLLSLVPVLAQEQDDGFAEIERLTRAIELIRSAYVDEGKIGYSDLIDSAIDGMLTGLDPHCQFMAPSLYENMKKSQTNTYDGVGIGVGMKNNAITIINVREDGPAAKAGVLPGDQIIQIGETFAEKVGAMEAIQMLCGKPGEELELTIRRPSTGDFITATMVRGVLRESTVRDALILPPAIAGDHKIGYVRLTQFNQPSAFEMERELEKLEKQGMSALVLDLRNNPGGLLNIAVDLLGLFLPPDTVVVKTRGRLKKHTPPPLRTPKKQIRPRRYPLVVLVNHGSASASELVSAALQDLRRAVIVGETTFGKGSVQSIIPTGKGAVRITTAKYYTPGERTIHEHGVEPDIIATTTPKKEAQLFSWWRERNRDTDLAGGLVRLQDPQLQRATDTLKALLAYAPMVEEPKPKAKPKKKHPAPPKEEPVDEPTAPEAPEADNEAEPELEPVPADTSEESP